MKTFRMKCKRTITENGEIQFNKDEEYEGIQYASGEIQGRSNTNQYLTVSDSGEWKFKEHFNIVK